MLGDKLTVPLQALPVTSIQPPRRNIPKAQEAIYEFLLEIVKTWTPENVLNEFENLFIHHSDRSSSSTLPYLYEIVLSNQEHEFQNTLKRSCYILINNWDISRDYDAIQKLVHLFSDPIIYKHTTSPTLKRLREWLRNFIASDDFQELKLFTSRYEECSKIHWSKRYTSYLLVPQYTNLSNPLEQRQAARNLSKKLKEKFKFDLARYTALSQDSRYRRQLENPTSLGDEVLRLVKRIVAKRGFFSYPNIAHIFLNQTQHLRYQDFKRSLLHYLIFAIEPDALTQQLQDHLAEKLEPLYAIHHDKAISSALLLRTVNRVIEYLTTENYREPSALFVLLLSQGAALTLVVVLLKLILICKHARTHLEVRIAELVRYYADYSEEECQWVITFFELFRIITTIYAENIDYNLVNMNVETAYTADWSVDLSQDAYRIFSQARRCSEPSHEPNLLELRAIRAAEAEEDRVG
ncbi:MAG: hypothetical protein IGS50_21530 [Synechococcales cyanobacterium C42_A2020_086]|nr:hypothetical protein [Synechococcales cyanobacterium C42_A2020_086]